MNDGASVCTLYTHTHVPTHLHTCTNHRATTTRDIWPWPEYVHGCVCVCVPVYVHVCICICMCVLLQRPSMDVSKRPPNHQPNPAVGLALKIQNQCCCVVKSAHDDVSSVFNQDKIIGGASINQLPPINHQPPTNHHCSTICTKQ